MPMDIKRLWAKSQREDQDEHPSMFLSGHLKDVYEAAKRVLSATGDDQLRALGLDPSLYRDRFRKCVLLAAAIHDLGKANDHFQGMICQSQDRRDKPQGIRHEWVTILMLKELREWLRPAVTSNLDFAMVEWAVSGHHPGHNHVSPPRTCPAGAGTQLQLCVVHKDFADCLNWIGTTFLGNASTPALRLNLCPLVGMGNAYSTVAAWFKSAQSLWDKSIRRSDDAKLLAAVKNCLIAADIAGSALPKADPHNPQRWDWITQSFQEMPKSGDLQRIVDERAKSFSERNEDRENFQTEVAISSSLVTFVKAGCGSGKTQAAYMWAAKNHTTRRLYFCYPTTGTATEGFKDYLYEPDVNADLFHSRRDVDFDIILSTGKDSLNADTDAAIRIDSLDSWATPIVACTVDTVLGIVQNNKRGLFAWPALAQSAFVFDEIHAYDDRLFGALLRFLRDLPGLPVLLMTASLPMPREAALKDVLKEFRGIELKPIAGPKELEELPRYHKCIVKENDPLTEIEKTLAAGGKVLWVCNTVKRVMDAADRAKHLNPLIYHSRFKYVDRVQRHKAVIDAFDPKKNSGAALAICSQVAEMSLDLSADLLVTDLATVPALIQRMGRLNRRAKQGDPTQPFIVIEPENNLPYSAADLEAAKVWFAKLADKDISQKRLADAWEQTAKNPPDLVTSAWLDGGPMTTVTELREASPGITVLMRSDVKRGDVGRYTLPMPPPPKALNWRSWPKHKGIPIVEDDFIAYDTQRGATWQKQ